MINLDISKYFSLMVFVVSLTCVKHVFAEEVCEDLVSSKPEVVAEKIDNRQKIKSEISDPYDYWLSVVKRSVEFSSQTGLDPSYLPMPEFRGSADWMMDFLNEVENSPQPKTKLERKLFGMYRKKLTQLIADQLPYRDFLYFTHIFINAMEKPKYRQGEAALFAAFRLYRMRAYKYYPLVELIDYFPSIVLIPSIGHEGYGSYTSTERAPIFMLGLQKKEANSLFSHDLNHTLIYIERFQKRTAYGDFSRKSQNSALRQQHYEVANKFLTPLIERIAQIEDPKLRLAVKFELFVYFHESVNVDVFDLYTEVGFDIESLRTEVPRSDHNIKGLWGQPNSMNRFLTIYENEDAKHTINLLERLQYFTAALYWLRNSMNDLGFAGMVRPTKNFGLRRPFFKDSF